MIQGRKTLFGAKSVNLRTPIKQVALKQLRGVRRSQATLCRAWQCCWMN